MRISRKPVNPHTLSTKLTQAATKPVNFLESKLKEDGSFGAEAKDLACYFKSPMMFIAADKKGSAEAVLKYIKTAFMTAEGDFKTSEGLKSTNGAYIEYWSYTNGWIARAANQLGMQEISKPANAYLDCYKMPKIGFLTNQVNTDSRMTDVLTMAHHGLIHLERDDSDTALSVGNYLCQAIAKQPDLKKGFYLRFDDNANVITDFPAKQTAFYFISATEPNQLHFMIGYPAAYLAILYKETQKEEFLKAAKDYLNFSLSCHESVFKCDFSHKIAWAASLLYECTGDRMYLGVIEQIADYFIGKQEKSGMWFSDINQSYDQSAEIACWFLDIVKNINALQKKAALEAKDASLDKSSTPNAIKSAVDALAAGVGMAAPVESGASVTNSPGNDNPVIKPSSSAT